MSAIQRIQDHIERTQGRTAPHELDEDLDQLVNRIGRTAIAISANLNDRHSSDADNIMIRAGFSKIQLSPYLLNMLDARIERKKSESVPA